MTDKDRPTDLLEDSADSGQTPAPQNVKLKDHELAILGVAQERIAAADVLMQLRRTEMQLTFDRLQQLYSENGKYRVTNIDIQQGVVQRVEN